MTGSPLNQKDRDHKNIIISNEKARSEKVPIKSIAVLDARFEDVDNDIQLSTVAMEASFQAGEEQTTEILSNVGYVLMDEIKPVNRLQLRQGGDESTTIPNYDETSESQYSDEQIHTTKKHKCVNPTTEHISTKDCNKPCPKKVHKVCGYHSDKKQLFNNLCLMKQHNCQHDTCKYFLKISVLTRDVTIPIYRIHRYIGFTDISDL